MVQWSEMGSYFLKVTRYLLLLPTTKNFVTVTYYLENIVTVIILHIIASYYFWKQLSNSLTMCHIATK